MDQTTVVMDSEGDAWWRRNKDKLPNPHDPVLQIIERNRLELTNVLELGCANGWRLAEIQKKHDARCAGYDISLAALSDGRRRFPKVQLYYGPASQLRYSEDGEFDLVIFGFMLYLADRTKLFQIVAESDRVLKDGSHLIIYDFDSTVPQTVPYHHDERLRTYKMPYWKLWTANPAYRLCHVRVGLDATDAAWLLKKDLSVWREECASEPIKDVVTSG